ncbi:MAG: hypothetical protein MPI95_06300 [Nitrosopumilus sp.]|nr:hypothetical protein [Nitrosopumilus sp.]CAI9831075.1 conserved hypothetical protein [Nitrosopumilaceae archaeon]MDA7941168.1 hypothetical protein [Nitrosopumilus sp.]MDA7942434.1 hypothetical protein [Nitrosopumilus sp.]MDA7944846.1 hypothetical protein [Nitrosopumilus sp.]
MEAHRLLTAAGGVLLVATVALNAGGHTYPAYAAGAAMLGSLGAGLFIFMKGRV